MAADGDGVHWRVDHVELSGGLYSVDAMLALGSSKGEQSNPSSKSIHVVVQACQEAATCDQGPHEAKIVCGYVFRTIVTHYLQVFLRLMGCVDAWE